MEGEASEVAAAPAGRFEGGKRALHTEAGEEEKSHEQQRWAAAQRSSHHSSARQRQPRGGRGRGGGARRWSGQEAAESDGGAQEEVHAHRLSTRARRLRGDHRCLHNTATDVPASQVMYAHTSERGVGRHDSITSTLHSPVHRCGRRGR